MASYYTAREEEEDDYQDDADDAQAIQDNIN